MAGFPRVRPFPVALCVGIVVLALHAPATARDARPAHVALGASSARIHLFDLVTAWRLRQSIDGAHEWLARASCLTIFSDFHDLSGRALSDVLAERGLTGQEQLDRLGFYDGSDLHQCAAAGAAFRTSPGYALVYVCPKGFRQLSSTPDEARATVIHEVLHTLGLGENPPAPGEITRRVLERCGGTRRR